MAILIVTHGHRLREPAFLRDILTLHETTVSENLTDLSQLGAGLHDLITEPINFWNSWYLAVLKKVIEVYLNSCQLYSVNGIATTEHRSSQMLADIHGRHS
jgi:hypothetical protein